MSNTGSANYLRTYQFMDAVLDDTLRDGTTFSGSYPGSYRYRFILRTTATGSTITRRDLDADTAEGWEDTTREATMENMADLFRLTRAAVQG